MAKRKRRKTTKKQAAWQSQVKIEFIGLTVLAFTVLGVLKMGVVGRAIYHMFRFFAGEWFGLIVGGLVLFAGYLIVKRKLPPFWTRRLAGFYLLGTSFLLLSHVGLFETLSREGEWGSASVIANTYELFRMDVTNPSESSPLGGGMIGALLFAFSYRLFDATGTQLMSFLLILLSFVLITGKSFSDVLGKIVEWIKGFVSNTIAEAKALFAESINARREKREQRAALREQEETMEQTETYDVSTQQSVQEEEPFEPEIRTFTESAYRSEPEAAQDKQEEPKNDATSEAADGTPIQSLTVGELENKDYRLPSLSLLQPPKKISQDNERQQISANARKLEKTFESFGVKAKVMKVHLGPAVTKYEVYPDTGVKVSKIVNLTDDLALALAARDLRIEAPIPGKSAIGIEVPNSEVAMVTLREVLESKEYQSHESRVAIGFGRDISGEAVVSDLSKMPHLLVAGATGSGKSVCINGIIASIMMKAKPHEVKMMMIDPKMVELNVYNGIPHLLAPVVTDPKKASQALKKVVSEMERRYELFSHTGTRNIEGYNNYIKRQNETSEAKQPTLPYIVVIVDELADLMMVASSDVEDAITRLAQMARAAGIHLIIATQRPSVDVITGVIKANIPSRIAFSVSSMTDSRTILDMGGAEKLLGKGDMLFLPVGANKPKRVQGAFLSDEEVEELVDFVIAQQKAQYQEEMIPTDKPEEEQPEVDDDLYDDAVQLITEMQTASVSMLQRRFRVGYTRAARLIDAMEARGIVGPYEGSKPREVLISKEEEAQSS
ncbi:FtsK/SpoIIIE family DNA translocase [Guptibacillus hwajinpoensis]|uniref:S-DNA-T family DNA segregation ATPase FtsK/SpoIIIE n=1 Tax=Guptibacillus hwajinpoensis TaxID=208199 RepID=A0ABU0K0M9_9BACL|nr:DNA translocase FtsK [Alkalihalobacillus hemicentroti]MDQ0482915.1 S-DNA-T family DNA segregation ATPase FtsK/SpoIIIE [Alkalihalobacillus hemicentroti]